MTNQILFIIVVILAKIIFGFETMVTLILLIIAMKLLGMEK